MASKDNTEQEPVKKQSRLKKIGKGFLLLVLVIAGFFLGIYLQIFDSDEMNKKMGLYNMPVVGQFFAKPVDEASSVPDEKDVQETANAKKDSEKSKPVKLTQKEIDKLTKQRQADEKKRVSKLARLYNDIVIAIFQRMDESQVSQILTEFDPDRAATISKIMYVGAPKRVQQVTNENGAVQQQQLQ